MPESPSPRSSRAASPTEGPLSILMIASEALPFSKTGGLADVAGSLPPALARLGHRVTVVVPRYRGNEGVGSEKGRADLAVGGRRYEIVFHEAPLRGARAILVRCDELYDRDGLYGVGSADYPDNAHRFAVLVRAAFELAIREAERPSLVHAHEWQGGLAPVYLETQFRRHPLLGGVGSVFTIHNLAYQGLFPAEQLPALDLDEALMTLDGVEHWGRISLLKGGINFSDLVTTVSRRYAKEILTPEFGFGFEGILARRRRDVVGILNGIDTEEWDPERDPHVPEPFSIDALHGKLPSKREVLIRYRLPADGDALERPLVGMISRMVDQKGLDLLAEIADQLPALGATFVVLGTGEERYERMWLALAARHPDRVGVRIGFDEALAHLVEAGADMFLMPSRFEPCGLNQMYSLRYGTVPIVRATGGLDDTVQAWNARTGRGNGFKFREYSSRALLRTLRQAIKLFAEKETWRRIQEAGMRADHSWDASAREYVKVYRRAVRRAAARRKQAAGVERSKIIIHRAGKD